MRKIFDISNSIYVELRKNVQTSSTINFNEASGPDNGEGLYILKGTETDTYPIYYYRGAVDDNNVLFGGFCWQIVRTTETGGIKMIYNGVATGDGETCENTEGASRQLATTSAFNSSHTSPSYAGYMYNQVYAYTNNAEVEGAYFGSGVSHNGSTYTLTGVYTDNDNTVKAAKDSDHHYTCNDASSYECPQVRYYYYNDYYITLTNGDTIEDALYKMTGNGSNETKTKNALYTLNQTSSLAKQNIETWFKTNLTNEEDETKTNYQAYLEDTIFCNDRSYKTVGSSSTYNQSDWNPNGGDLSKYLFFGSNNRIHNSWYSATNIPALKNEGEFPNIACPNETDRFSVGSTVAHLNYPVGLLTADEIVLAGASGNNGSIADNPFYLYTGEIYWSFTPYNFYSGNVGEFIIDADGCMKNLKVSYNRGLRPVISLKLGTEFEPGGEGTTTNPYKVKIN